MSDRPTRPSRRCSSSSSARRGIDFTGYKRTSLERRFRRRMDAVGCESFGDYLDYLEVHPDEYEQLFDTLLINVTEFFRDPPAWEHLREDGPARRCSAAQARRTSRSASGAPAARRGQEAYTIAMVLAELLGVEAYRERVKIYATDIDEDALGHARAWPSTRRKEIESVPEDLRERYFERADQRLAFRKDLRRTRDLRPQQPRRRTRRSRGWTCSSAATRSCTSTRRRRRGSCATSTSRCATRGVLMLGQVRDDDLAPRPLRADRPQAAHLRKRAARTPLQARVGAHRQRRARRGADARGRARGPRRGARGSARTRS